MLHIRKFIRIICWHLPETGHYDSMMCLCNPSSLSQLIKNIREKHLVVPGIWRRKLPLLPLHGMEMSRYGIQRDSRVCWHYQHIPARTARNGVLTRMAFWVQSVPIVIWEFGILERQPLQTIILFFKYQFIQHQTWSAIPNFNQHFLPPKLWLMIGINIALMFLQQAE